MSAIVVGRIGEYIAAAVLEMYQYQTVLCQQAGFDLIASRGKQMWRCQVKASTFHNYHPDKMQFHFGIGGAKRIPTIIDYDFAALVSIPHRRVFFMPIEEVVQKVLSRKGEFFETPDLETNSLTHTMEILNARFTEPAPMHK